MSALQITNQEIQTSFDFSEAFVLEMKTKADALTILGVDDKEGYNAVNEARKLIKEKRVQVEKKRNELNADALAYQRTVNAEAKRITAMLEPIEQELTAKTKVIDSEKERIKLEERQRKQEKTAGRIGQILGMEMTQIGGMYYVGQQRISHNEVETWDDEIWTDFVQICEREYYEIKRIEAETKAAAIAAAQRDSDEREAERKRLETIAQEQKAEAERLKKIADEQEVERIRLEATNTTVKKINARSINGVKEILAIAPVFDAEFIEPVQSKNRKAMAQANAISFLRDKGFLLGGSTEFIISFAGNRPSVDLAELMGEFLCESWSTSLT